MEDVKLIAKKRVLEGTGNARRLRNDGTLPGVVYGDEKEPVSVTVDMHDFEQILHHHVSESLLLEIELEGEGDISVLIKDVQHHPVTSDLMHVDLQRVSANKPIHVDVPIALIGESEGVKAGGTLDHVMHSIGVECLPKDLVEAFEVNVSGLKIGDSLSVADMNLGDKYKLLVDEDAIIASVTGPKSESDEDDAGTGEPEVIKEKKAE